MLNHLSSIMIIAISAVIPFIVAGGILCYWYHFIRPDFCRDKFIVKCIATLIVFAVAIIMSIGLAEIAYNDILFELRNW